MEITDIVRKLKPILNISDTESLSLIYYMVVVKPNLYMENLEAEEFESLDDEDKEYNLEKYRDDIIKRINSDKESATIVEKQILLLINTFCSNIIIYSFN